MTRFAILAIAGYVLLVAVITGALFQARYANLTSSNPERQKQAWEAWREDVRRQRDDDLPVRRRVPDSSEPPAMVLLRDNFGTIFVGSLGLTSVLYWASVILARGVLYGPRFQIDTGEPSPPKVTAKKLEGKKIGRRW